MNNSEMESKASLYEAIRFFVIIGTLGILVLLGFYLVLLGFGKGIPSGVRSISGVLLPILAGSFVFVVNRGIFNRLRALSSSLAFLGSATAGVLVMLALQFLVQRTPIPITELMVSSCMVVLLFTPGSISSVAFRSVNDDSDRTLPYFYGITSGMLLYVVIFGLPIITG